MSCKDGPSVRILSPCPNKRNCNYLAHFARDYSRCAREPETNHVTIGGLQRYRPRAGIIGFGQLIGMQMNSPPVTIPSAQTKNVHLFCALCAQLRALCVRDPQKTTPLPAVAKTDLRSEFCYSATIFSAKTKKIRLFGALCNYACCACEPETNHATTRPLHTR